MTREYNLNGKLSVCVNTLSIILITQFLIEPVKLNAQVSNHVSADIGLNSKSSPTEFSNHIAVTSNQNLKVVVNSQNGSYAIVNAGKNIVTLKTSDDKIIWPVDVVKVWGDAMITGAKKIRDLRLSDNNLFVTLGKHSYITIDIRTGAPKVFGAD